MAWPKDAVIDTYIANDALPSSTINEIQERIVDANRERTVELIGFATPYLDGSNDPVQERLVVEDGWITGPGVGATDEFFVDAAIPAGDAGWFMKQLDVKWYNAHPTSSLVVAITPYIVTTNYGSAASAPTKASLGALSGSVAATSWGVSSLASIDTTLTADQRLCLHYTTSSTGDKIASIRLTYEPITET